MTIHLLEVTPSDVAASALGYRVDCEPAPEALVSEHLVHPDGRSALEVSILGASHAVTVRTEGGVTMTEEISCHAAAAGGGPLPRAIALPGPWGTHRLSTASERLGGEEFAELVCHLVSRAHAEENVLAGRFPGGDGALTAVAVAAEPAGGWTWSTWHLYPVPDGHHADGGDVVTTVSRLEATQAGAIGPGGDNTRMAVL